MIACFSPSLGYSQDQDIRHFDVKIKQWNDNFYEIKGTDLIIEFKSTFSPRISHSKYSGWEDVKLTVFIFSIHGKAGTGGSACWRNEDVEYNYVTGEYEDTVKWDDCYKIEEIFQKVDPSELDSGYRGIKHADDYGKVEEIDFLLIPCDADCF